MVSLTKKKYKDMNTQELVELAQQDDYNALEQLIRHEQKNVYAAFYYLDPNRENLMDLTQEVLLRMSKNIKSLKNPKTFKAWLSQIVSNLFYDELRKKQRKPNVISIDTHWHNDEKESPVMEIKDTKAKPEEKTLGKELSDVINETICKLPEQFKFAIVLREVQGLSYEEIAEITKTSVGTVKSRISRARNKMQECLKSYLT